ncbi:DUF4442 domain-containing protein [Thermobifida halotolerans]|uniref:DUF4442 domain-containing protein n=1 Tax=Thermobifida halotolerans TaxID=483545 RepID=A0A399G274_9ACTN|nr:DUF4442 domain-containing protein [Thermobifida halotolerans]UOE19141.1 DUF4442 domain-containing protein [Thermobifida halotolerans]
MVTTDADFVKSSILAAIPFARALRLEFVELAEDRAVMRLPDNPDHHDHAQGQHSGALLALAETASGAAVFNALGDRLRVALPLAVRAGIDHRQPVGGAVRAEARLGEEWHGAVAELEAGGRPEFPVEVELRTEDGAATAAATIVWTLRPYR